MPVSRLRTLIAGLVLGAWPAFAGAALAQQGTISGQVTAEDTGQPLQGIRLLLVGSAVSAETDGEGRYRLAGIPVGRAQIRVAGVGYQSQVATVSVAAGQTVTLDFSLDQAVVTLDAVVVTATGERRRREIANNVTTIDASEAVDVGAVTSMSNLLQGRASSVTVTQGSGSTGAGSRVRIRGPSSIGVGNEPLIYVDGVRLDNTQDALSIGTGGQTTSRLSDLNPEEIESIEIIRGAAAATLYGTEAANGVILITTKRGRRGVARWNFWAEGGAVVDPTDYPTNFAALDDAGDLCINFSAAAGSCTQAELESFNPLLDESSSPISIGNREQFGGNVSGGSDVVTYFLSGEWEREVGTFELPDTTRLRLTDERGTLPGNLIRPNRLERVSVRANIGARPSETINLDAAVGYVSSGQLLPQNDNNSLGMIPSAFLGGSTAETGWGFFTPEQVFAIATESNVNRFTGSVTGTWTPLTWLTTLASGGVDFTSQFDNQFFPTGEVPAGTLIDGTRVSNRIQRFQWTGRVNATASVHLTSAITSRSTAGFDFFKNRLEQTTANGNRLPAGVNSLAGAVIVNASENTNENTTIGGFAEQQFGLNDRLFLTGGVRVDANNNFGTRSNTIVYPRASASYVISDEAFFPAGATLTSLRLRAAYGQSGVQPPVNAAVQFFTPVAVTDGGQDVVGVTIGALGNEELKPERTEEFEFGFDSELFDGRVGLDLTYYRSRTKDQIVSRVIAPSLGSATNQFLNLAEVQNSGFEAQLRTQLVSTPSVTWSLDLSGNTNRNEVIELGEDVEPIIFGLGGDAQRHQEGFPAGAYFQRPILSFEDENGDGIIGGDEVVVGDTSAFLGTPFPRREATIHSTLTLWNRIRISGLMDHRGGHKLQNGTGFFRCAQFFNCESAHVPGADLAEQAGIAAFLTENTRAGFVENASFWKLRELSVTLFAPESWARALGNADRLSLTFIGRNLATITDYRGVDPEIITSAGAQFSTADFLTQPPVRYYQVRLNLGF